MKKVGKTTMPFRYDLNQIPYDYTMKMMNRLNRSDRVTTELWMEVCNTVQESMTKTISKEKEMQEGKVIV